MKNFYTYLIVALTGGAGYCLIEILYRGRTHYSMFFRRCNSIIIILLYKSKIRNEFLAQMLGGNVDYNRG